MLALGPALAPGFVLSYDMVFVPDPPLSPVGLGFAGGPPRAVPSDLIVALAARIIPAQLVQKLILLAIFVLACSGAAALLAAGWAARPGSPSLPLPARLAAGICYAWNPFVAERLIMGQWATLLGYAGLPWVLREFAVLVRGGTLPAGGHPRAPDGPEPPAGVLVRGGTLLTGDSASWGHPRPRWPRAPDGPEAPAARPVRLGRLAMAAIPAAIGGFAAMSVTVVAVLPAAACGGRTWRDGARRTAAALAVIIAFSLPWVIPALASPVRADPNGAAAFAARGDTPFGTGVSLLMLGGIWNAQAVPAGYGGLASVIWLAVVILAAACYLLVARPRRICPGLGIGAIAGACIAALGLTGPTLAALHAAISFWPGFALLRDGQQFIAPLALAESIGLGAGVGALMSLPAAATSRRGARAAGPANAGVPGVGPRAGTALGVLALIAPVLLLPGLAWGAAGRLQAVSYPADWLRARQIIDGDTRPGTVLLLPWAQYRRYPWNHGEAVFDPWPQFIARPVIWNDALRVGNMTVAAESRQALLIGPDITSGRPLTTSLRDFGVRYVIIDSGPLLGQRPSRLAALARLPGAQVVLASSDLIVLRLRGFVAFSYRSGKIARKFPKLW